jgi:uncharacterized protein (DUF2235 family)
MGRRSLSCCALYDPLCLFQCRSSLHFQDGTSNKYQNNDKQTNILKIYRMLDRSSQDQYSWYNPGIGTYVNTSKMDHHGPVSKVKSWYSKSSLPALTPPLLLRATAKTKDQAFGSSLADHVMAGYKFLMRFYSPEDDIYIFGFSRGAYTAKFLAEMLDHIGLLSAGNEELQSFAWKTFSKWQARPGAQTEEDKAKRQELYDFMKGFRETFSRPVRRIRFLGLFDTVNSVPRFEGAMMKRAKFPYSKSIPMHTYLTS